MNLEYRQETHRGITIDELKAVIDSSYNTIESFEDSTEGLCALEASHIINGFKRAIGDARPPRLETVVEKLDENDISNSQAVIAKGNAAETSRSTGGRVLARKIMRITFN